MLCEIARDVSPLATWLVLSALGVVAALVFSGSVFLAYYARPTFAQWRRKLNPEFPSALKVREEVLQTLKSICVATLCPAASLYLAQSGRSRAYCGDPLQKGVLHHALQLAAIWVATDFFEWAYHYVGHSFAFTWANHKAHHRYFNPSPFAVIADDFIDQFVRSLPLVLFPLAFDVNIDLLFVAFAIIFYGYGTVLHWGYESSLDVFGVHGSIGSRLNGSYEHYVHHSTAALHTPLYCGFFFKVWDSLAGSVPAAGSPCKCSRCECERGQRTEKQWLALKKPDYSVLLAPQFWIAPGSTASAAAAS
jgi:lathosterol oxidase